MDPDDWFPPVTSLPTELLEMRVFDDATGESLLIVDFADPPADAPMLHVTIEPSGIIRIDQEPA